MLEKKKKVIVIGGGPAGMMAAWQLAKVNEVHLFDKESRIGKKLLVAGKGGLNITNGLDAETLKTKYSPPGFIDKALIEFDNSCLRDWLLELSIPTYIGSSGKVFPERGITGLDVFNKVEASLVDRGVIIHTYHRLIKFDELMNFTFDFNGAIITQQCDFAVLALGGASWPQTGSDGTWLELFKENGINTLPFKPSNCGVNIEWPTLVSQFHAGKPLKNITIKVGDKVAKGEALITDNGLEGTAIYPLIPEIRHQIEIGIIPKLVIDFKPQNSKGQLLEKLRGAGKVKSNRYKEVLSIQNAEMALIKSYTHKDTFDNPGVFCDAIKKVGISVQSLRPIEEAISVTGGLDLLEVNEDFSLLKFPKVFTVGEMLNWDAPTGGYLLQGCFTMGAHVAACIKSVE